MYIFDTDMIIIMQHKSEPEWSRLFARVAKFDRSQSYVTTVSVHEQFLGAHNYIAKGARAKIIRGYQMIEWAMLTYNDYKVLPFDEPSAIQFEQLRKQKVRIATMDLRIASIALSHDFTVLTRNTVDFDKVPGLRVEDWTTI